MRPLSWVPLKTYSQKLPFVTGAVVGVAPGVGDFGDECGRSPDYSPN
jgi:hypothetical protein